MRFRVNINSRAKLNAKMKRELAVQARLDGYNLHEIMEIAGYASTGAASNAIDQWFKANPPEDIERKRDIERQRLEAMRRDLLGMRKGLLELLAKAHVVIQHGKVVGRFAGWKTDPDDPQVVMRDADDKPIPTFDEIEDDDPSIRIYAELRQNVAAQVRVSESLRKLDGMDKPIVIKIEDEDGLDEEIEQLVEQLNENLVGPPLGHEG